MKEISKYRILNKIRIITMGVLTLGLFMSWYFLSGMHEGTFGLKLLEHEIPYAEQIQQQLISKSLEWDVFVSSTYDFVSSVLVIFVVALTALYLYEKRGYLPYKYQRLGNYGKNMLADICKHAGLNALSIFAPYLLFFTIGAFMCTQISDVPRTAFASIFGEDFFYDYMPIYFFLEGFIKFFVFSFVYSAFSISVSLNSQKAYNTILLPIAYYFFSAIIFQSVFSVRWLAPTFTLGFSSYLTVHFWEALIPLVIPLCVAIGNIIYACIRGEKNG